MQRSYGIFVDKWATWTSQMSLQQLISRYRFACQQQLVYSLEDVSICAESGGVSAAVRSQICLINMTEGRHQPLKVTRRHTQCSGWEDGGSWRLLIQEFTLRPEGRYHDHRDQPGLSSWYIHNILGCSVLLQPYHTFDCSCSSSNWVDCKRAATSAASSLRGLSADLLPLCKSLWDTEKKIRERREATILLTSCYREVHVAHTQCLQARGWV